MFAPGTAAATPELPAPETAVVAPETAVATPEDPAAGEAASAGAATAPTAPPGNNGTVKIHEGADEPTPEARNQPHVCTFHVHARGFDGGQALQVTVLSWPPTGDRGMVLEGTLDTDDTGGGRWPETGALSLPDGHYRLVVDTGDAEPTRDKHKMFWVRCDEESVLGGSSDQDDEGSNGGGGGRKASHGTHGTAAFGTTPSGTASDAPSGNPAASDAAPTASTSSASELPITGAGPIALIAAAGVGLVTLGLALRRRRAPM